MKRAEIKRMVESYGFPRFRVAISELLRHKEHPLRPEEVSFRGLWEALVGPVDETLDLAISQRTGFRVTEAAVDSNAFADISGVVLAAKVIEGYNAAARIGDDLVTVVPSRRKAERYPGYTALEKPKLVHEATDYEEMGFHDKYMTSEAFKKGRLLNVTEEAILFDEVGQVLLRAGQIGEKAAYEREEVILNGFQDVALNVFRPQGVAEALYRLVGTATAPTITDLNGNALVDWLNIDAADQVFAAMTDENGDRILIEPDMLVVPRGLQQVARRIVNATEIRQTAGVGGQVIFANPVTGLQVRSSALLTGTHWWYGQPNRQFIWQQIWPIQVLRATLPEDQHVRDIVVSFKVRSYGGIAAIDDKYVVRSGP